MKKALNQKFVEAIKADPGKRQEFADTIAPNLVLIVQPSGSKSWAWRGKLDGKNQKVTYGAYPAHDLDDARTWANRITVGRDNGVNVVEQARMEVEQEKARVAAEKAAAEQVAIDKTRTGQWLFDLYMEHEGSSRKSADEKRRQWNNDLKKVLGNKLVSEIDHDCLAAIVREKHAVAPIMSNALVALIKRWFKWCVTLGRDVTGLKVNPAVDIVKLAPPSARKRFLADWEITLFFESLDLIETRAKEALTLILYTGARRAEAFEAPWTEFDLVKGQWIIPEERTKNGLEHVVSLCDTVLAMMKEVRRKGNGDGLVWPSYACVGEEEERGISGFSNIMESIHQKMVERAAKRFGGKKIVEPFSIHDLRRTLVSGMNALHDEDDSPLIPENIVERCVNHKLGGMKGIYNRYAYYKEKKAAFRIWGDHLDRLRKIAVVSALPQAA